MSLLARASPWNDNNDKVQIRKRIPSMRKTQKKTPLEKSESDELDNETLNEKEIRPSSFEEDTKFQEERQERVTKMLSTMSNLEENGESELTDFTPLSPPEVQKKTIVKILFTDVMVKKTYLPFTMIYVFNLRKFVQKRPTLDPLFLI